MTSQFDWIAGFLSGRGIGDNLAADAVVGMCRILLLRWRRHRHPIGTVAQMQNVDAIPADGRLRGAALRKEAALDTQLSRRDRLRALTVVSLLEQTEHFVGAQQFDRAEEHVRSMQRTLDDVLRRQTARYSHEQLAPTIPRLLMWTHIHLGNVAKDRGDPAKAVEQYGMASRIAVRIGDTSAERVIESGTGFCYLAEGQYDAARTHLDAALLIAPPDATTANNLAVCLAELGLGAQALRLMEQALTLYRALEPPHSDENRRKLALALTHRASLLCQLDRHSDAVPDFEEAISLMRGFEARSEADARAQTVSIYNGYCRVLSFMGRSPEALIKNDQGFTRAASMCRSTTVASSLVMVALYRERAMVLRDLGRLEDAIRACDDGIRLVSSGSADRPDRVQAEAALLLDLKGTLLGQDGSLTEAVRCAQSAVRIIRSQQPETRTTTRHTAMMLNNLGTILHSASDLAASLASLDEAKSIYDDLGDAAGLAMVLTNKALVLDSAGEQRQALRVSEQAIAIIRRLHADQPAVYRDVLCKAINNRGACLLHLNLLTAAVEAFDEVIAVSRSQPNPNLSSRLRLLGALLNKGMALCGSGRTSVALSVLEEAVSIQRELAATGISRSMVPEFLKLADEARPM